MAVPTDIEGLLRALAADTGHEALSEAKRIRLEVQAPEIVRIEDGGVVVAVGVAAPHDQPDGSVHWAIETVVRPDLAVAAFEGAVVDQTLATLEEPDRASAWSTRASLDAALSERGFVRVRELRHMVTDLPVVGRDPTGPGIRMIDETEVDALIAINGRAFAGHREAGALDRPAFDALREEPWFDLAGILVADTGSELAGFCWTKVHLDGPSVGDGEIYRIAVEPSHHGEGWGRRLVVAGFEVLTRHPDVRRGTLWVEGDNGAAIGLYESIGMAAERVTAEFERPQPKR